RPRTPRGRPSRALYSARGRLAARGSLRIAPRSPVAPVGVSLSLATAWGCRPELFAPSDPAPASPGHATSPATRRRPSRTSARCRPGLEPPVRRAAAVRGYRLSHRRTAVRGTQGPLHNRTLSTSLPRGRRACHKLHWSVASRSLSLSVQRALVEAHGHSRHDDHEQQHGPELGPAVPPSGPFEHHAAHQAIEISERQHFVVLRRPARHPR